MQRLGVLAMALVVIVVTAPTRASGQACESFGSELFSNEAFSANGRQLCFTSELADGGQEVFATTKKGVVSLAKDGKRCRGDAKNGQPCTTSSDCPGSECVSGAVSRCNGTANGKLVYFIFSGNPSGGNNDVGGELFSFDTKKKTLTQVTTQTGWCSNDLAKVCTTFIECDAGGFCQTASMSDLHVSPDGKVVAFVSDGDPGGNAGHDSGVFTVTKGKVTRVDQAARVCSSSTANAGQACKTDEDCGAKCGDGTISGSEQCDLNTGGCSQGQYCAPAGSAGQCTCKTIACGNNIRESNEQCDGTDIGFCDQTQTCGAGCTCVPKPKVATLCGNNKRESGEDCDGIVGCGAFQMCTNCKCVAKTQVCPNGKLEANEDCDGAAFPCPTGFTCDGMCQCVQGASLCGNNHIDPGEDCDGTATPKCATGFTCNGCPGRCDPTP